MCVSRLKDGLGLDTWCGEHNKVKKVLRMEVEGYRVKIDGNKTKRTSIEEMDQLWEIRHSSKESKRKLNNDLKKNAIVRRV